jgi:Ser/Thr protein kinase RdoA (MazF antagonist)
MLSPHPVIARYPAALRGSLVPLGNHGGFSGAELWRLDAPGGEFCLKAWPADWRSADDLAWIHGLLRRTAVLSWMPRVLVTSDGASFVHDQGRLWDVTTWMPGVADFWQSPSTSRLEAACTALAHLHHTWADATISGVCPAILRRRDARNEWQALVHSGWRPDFVPLDPLAPDAEQLWRLLVTHIDELDQRITPWLGVDTSVQPCVCDLWHEHVLFQGEHVSGFIDFGSAKIDSVAADLARMLGSLVGDDDAMWQLGLAAYERVRPLSTIERALARDLDRAGTILAAAQWLRWLYHDGRQFANVAMVRERLQALTRRLATCPPGSTNRG